MYIGFLLQETKVRFESSRCRINRLSKKRKLLLPRLIFTTEWDSAKTGCSVAVKWLGRCDLLAFSKSSQQSSTRWKSCGNPSVHTFQGLLRQDMIAKNAKHWVKLQALTHSLKTSINLPSSHLHWSFSYNIRLLLWCPLNAFFALLIYMIDVSYYTINRFYVMYRCFVLKASILYVYSFRSVQSRNGEFLRNDHLLSGILGVWRPKDNRGQLLRA